jgi:hypothetical protein
MDNHSSKPPYFTFSNPRAERYFMAGLWVVVQSLLFWKNGILTQLEAAKYVDQAHIFLQTGGFESGNFLYYSVEILLISLCLKAHVSFLFLVILQWTLNGVSMICFYKAALLLSKRSSVALIATTALITMVYYQEFNSFLYTESLYFSLSVIYTYFLFRSPGRGLKGFFPVFLLIILLYFTRPTGIFFLPATLLFFVFKAPSGHSWWKLPMAGVSLLLLYFLVNLSIGSGGEFNFLLPYLRENIICGVSSVAIPHHFNMPADPNSLGGILYIISHHFGLFAKLSAQRLLAFFGVYRSYYSLLHNTVIILFFFVPYGLILRGSRGLFQEHRAESIFLVTLIALMAITVMITCDEWANRFILGEFPMVLLLTVIACGPIISRHHLPAAR